MAKKRYFNCDSPVWPVTGMLLADVPSEWSVEQRTFPFSSSQGHVEFEIADECAGVGGWMNFTMAGYAPTVTTGQTEITSQGVRVNCGLDVTPGGTANDAITCDDAPTPGGVGSQLGITMGPTLPIAPSREDALHVRISFQGLLVTTQQFGPLPWFEAALAWLTPEDRSAVYTAKQAAGDTHALIMVPSGIPLYDEPGQPYSPDRFGSLDWTLGETAMDPAFAALVIETRLAGFIPLVFMDERPDHSLRIMPLVINALQQSVYGDISDQVAAILPGWDGVFYGWPVETIQQWASTARAMCPLVRLGLEHNQGHIPLGEGGSDYLPGGRMQDFDLVLGEYNSWEGHTVMGDTIWQIVSRMVHPYTRPLDQPIDDDPNPPFYLAHDNPRGPFVYCAFEFWEYPWVRVNMADPSAVALMQQQIAAERAYLLALGSSWTG